MKTDDNCSQQHGIFLLKVNVNKSNEIFLLFGPIDIIGKMQLWPMYLCLEVTNGADVAVGIAVKGSRGLLAKAMKDSC